MACGSSNSMLYYAEQGILAENMDSVLYFSSAKHICKN